MKELSFDQMEQVSGGNQCSNYDNALSTGGFIAAGLGLALVSGGSSLILAGIGFAISYASILSCNGVKPYW